MQEDVERQQQEEYWRQKARERSGERPKEGRRPKGVQPEPLRRPLPKPQTPVLKSQAPSCRPELESALKQPSPNPAPTTPSLIVHPSTSMLNSPNVHPRINHAPTPTPAPSASLSFQGFFPQPSNPFIFPSRLPRQMFGQSMGQEVGQHLGGRPEPHHHHHPTRKCWQNPHCPCNEDHSCCWCRRCVRTHRVDRSQ